MEGFLTQALSSCSGVDKESGVWASVKLEIKHEQQENVGELFP